MIPPGDAAAFLPPTFQILTGLTFAALLLIRFLAAPMLRPLWGKLFAFSVMFAALGFFLLSVGTAKSDLNGAAEMLTLGGISFFVVVVLTVIAFVVGARGLVKGNAS
jgi:hypothetical protein